MNKTYKYTLSAGEKKEITFDVGVYKLAITNANGKDGGGVTYTAGDGIAISEDNVISNTAKGNTDIIAEEYDNAKSYVVGDYCIYDNKLYRCISPITPPYWYKIPKEFSNDLKFTNVSANPEDCYVSVTSNGHWILASASQNQIIRFYLFGTNIDLALNYTYDGTESVGYFNGYDYYSPSIIAQHFANGGYASESDALADLFSRPYFDSSKWTEVSVTDEIKSLKVYSTEEHVVGVWIDGKPIYEKTINFGTLPNGTVKAVDHNISNLDYVVSVNMIAVNTVAKVYIPLPYIVTTADDAQLYISETKINVITPSDYRDYGNSFVTIQYTKTTD